jgi:hypothetical protein
MCGMKRQLTGLNAANHYLTGQIPDGIYLVSVRKARFHRQARKPYYTLDVLITEPVRFVDRVMSSRIYCNQRALWKMNWFLRDFAYDPDLLERDEIDEKRLIGLRGVVKVSRIAFDGTPFLRFDGFAPAEKWQELSPANLDRPLVP